MRYVIRSVTLILLATSGCSSPESSFKSFVYGVKSSLDLDRIISCEKGGVQNFYKRHILLDNIRYDIRKTDSVVSPFIATLTVDETLTQSDVEPTKEKASAASSKGDPLITKDLKATFAFQDGKWVLKEFKGETFLPWVKEVDKAFRGERPSSREFA